MDCNEKKNSPPERGATDPDGPEDALAMDSPDGVEDFDDSVVMMSEKD